MDEEDPKHRTLSVTNTLLKLDVDVTIPSVTKKPRSGYAYLRHGKLYSSHYLSFYHHNSSRNCIESIRALRFDESDKCLSQISETVAAYDFKRKKGASIHFDTRPSNQEGWNCEVRLNR